MTRVEVEGLSRHYGPSTALDGVDLSIEDGEIVAVLGPSGSGKSTLLRIVAGLETPTEGRVLIDGRDVTDLPPGERNVAVVFQDATTLPHLTVADNIGIGLRIRRRPRREIQARVAEVGELLGLGALMDRRPGQLSGGERQRVAIGRALLRDPHIFLMDEPLSSLDAPVRLQLRQELARLHRELGTTILYVTHDQIEALTLGGRVAVMNRGRIEQVGVPNGVYGDPETLFVATFVGVPPMNLLAGPAVTLGVRPDDLALERRTAGAVTFAAVVEDVESHGSHCYVQARLTGESAGTPMAIRADIGTVLAPGDHVVAWADPARIHRFDTATGAVLRGRPS